MIVVYIKKGGGPNSYLHHRDDVTELERERRALVGVRLVRVACDKTINTFIRGTNLCDENNDDLP